MDRELGFNPNREFDFDPNDGLIFDPDRELEFDHTRDLGFGERGVLFRGQTCQTCGTENHHNEEICPGCNTRLHRELKLEYIPSRTMSEIEWEEEERRVAVQRKQKKEIEARQMAAKKPPTARKPKPRERPVQKAAATRASKAKAHKKRTAAGRCGSCGVRVSQRHPYCWNCAAPIEQQQQAPKAKAKAKSRLEQFKQGQVPGLFPVIFRCSGCQAKIRVREPGKFSCPACDTMTRVDSRGYTRPVEEIH